MLDKICAYLAFLYIMFCVGNALIGSTLNVGGSLWALALLITQSQIIGTRGAA